MTNLRPSSDQRIAGAWPSVEASLRALQSAETSAPPPQAKAVKRPGVVESLAAMAVGDSRIIYGKPDGYIGRACRMSPGAWSAEKIGPSEFRVTRTEGTPPSPEPPEADMDPAEMPSPDAVAHAVVAAARITGEDPLEVGVGIGLRFRFPAMKALRVFYPDADWAQLGRWVGITANAHSRLTGAEKSSWWPTEGEPAFAAAFEALEAI